MIPLGRPRRAIGPAIIAVSALLFAGCAEELGPVPMPVTRVRGVVRMGDRPLRGGWIEFVPTGETIGSLRSSRVGPDGRFDADGVAVGTNTIRVVDAPIDSSADLVLLTRMRWAAIIRQADGRVSPSEPARLFIPFASPIRRTIAAEGSPPMAIDVVAEAVKFQEEMGRAMSALPPAPGTETGEGP